MNTLDYMKHFTPEQTGAHSDSVAQARASIGRYMAFFNTERRHQSLGRRTPDTVYYGSADHRKAA